MYNDCIHSGYVTGVASSIAIDAVPGNSIGSGWVLVDANDSFNVLLASDWSNMLIKGVWLPRSIVV